MSRRELIVVAEAFPLAQPFTIARGARAKAEVVTVTVCEGEHAGRGEATPNPRYGESVASTVAAIEALREAVVGGLERGELQEAMAPGAARNALDCALWDLEAKRGQTTVWELVGRTMPPSLATAYTLSLADPNAMAEEARRRAARPVLKLKLGGGEDVARVAAVRKAVPDVRLIADANEALSADALPQLLEELARLGIELLEQPLAADADAALADLLHPVPLCADESCHVAADVPRLAGRYEAVNIKLDKTGGLTEALELQAAARKAGLKIMVGCMVSTSLGLAPAQIVAARADWVDLDSALYLAQDRPNGISYGPSDMAIAAPALWG